MIRWALHRFGTLIGVLWALGASVAFADNLSILIGKNSQSPISALPAPGFEGGSSSALWQSEDIRPLGDQVYWSGQWAAEPGVISLKVNWTDRQNRAQTGWLRASLDHHRALLTAALMRRLGYQTRNQVILSSARIRLPSLGPLVNAWNDLEHHWAEATGISPKRWSLNRIADDAVVADVVLEKGEESKLGSEWQLNGLGSEEEPYQAGRASRALIATWSVTNVTEDLNGWAHSDVSEVQGFLLLRHARARLFKSLSWEDLLWWGTEISKISAQQWSEVVQEAGYPKGISEWVTARVIERRNEWLRLLRVSDPIPVDVEITSGCNSAGKSCRISRGVIQTPKWEECVLEYGDKDSRGSVDSRELNRHIWIATLSDIGATALDGLLGIIRPSLIGKMVDRPKELQFYFKFLDEVRKRPPGTFLQHQITAFHGPVANVDVEINRAVMVGGPLGEDRIIRLVDMVAVSGVLGYFVGLEGLPYIVPGFGGNLKVKRSWVHVRPLGDVGVVEKMDYAALFAPLLMRAISRDQRGPFLELVADGESFSTIDYLQSELKAGVSVPLLAFINPALSMATYVSAGVRGALVTLNRSTVRRVGGQLQVLLQRGKSRTFGAYFDWYALVKVLEFGVSHRDVDSTVDAYLYRLDEPNEHLRNMMRLGLNELIGRNNPKVIKDYLPSIKFDQNSKTDLYGFRFLPWRVDAYNEWRTLKSRTRPDHFLISRRQVVLDGRFHPGLSFESPNGAGLGTDFVASRSGLIPAHGMFGASNWTTVESQAEVTSSTFHPIVFWERDVGGARKGRTPWLALLRERELEFKRLLRSKSEFDYPRLGQGRRAERFEVRTTMVVPETGLEQVRGVFWKAYRAADENERKLSWLRLASFRSRVQTSWACRNLIRKDLWIKTVSDSELNALASGLNESEIKLWCIPLWMQSLAKSAPMHLPLGGAEFEAEQRNYLKWTNRVFSHAPTGLSAAELGGWLGVGSAFVHVRVGAFLPDATPKVPYVSDWIGSGSDVRSPLGAEDWVKYSGAEDWMLQELNAGADMAPAAKDSALH